MELVIEKPAAVGVLKYRIMCIRNVQSFSFLAHNSMHKMLL